MSVLHSTSLYFLVSQVQGFLIFCGICSNILFLLSCWVFVWMPHVSGTMTELVREAEDRGLSQEPVPGLGEITALAAFGNCKDLLGFISHHCGLYISICMPMDGKKNHTPLQSRSKGKNRSLLFSIFKYP